MCNAIFRSYCTRMLVAEEKSLTLFRISVYKHAHARACASRAREWVFAETTYKLLFLYSFKIDKTWNNFFISAPILIIKIPLFSVFNTQCNGIKQPTIPHLNFIDWLTKYIPHCFAMLNLEISFSHTSCESMGWQGL